MKAVTFQKGEGVSYGDTTVLLYGHPVAIVSKRAMSYSGIRGANGRRLGTYTYFDTYALADPPATRGQKLASYSTRKQSVADALVRLAFANEGMREVLLEGAREVEPDTAKRIEEHLS